MRICKASAILLTALLIASCSSSPTAQPSGSPNSKSAAYQQAYEVGLAAYTYGLPLLTTNATFLTMTSVGVSNGAYGPVNQFNNVRSANTSKSKAVVAPGATSLSSIAWLDLSKEPQVLQVPKVSNNFFVLAFIDPYTENIVNLGSATQTAPGNYVVAGPGQAKVANPSGTHRINVDYDRIWVIGSTQLKGANDVKTVNAIQDKYLITPLSKFGQNYKPSTPSNPATTPTVHAVPSGLQFFDTLGQLLTEFPPPAADAAVLKTFASVGIGAGQTPSQETSLSADTKQGLIDAVAAGQGHIQQLVKGLYGQDAKAHNGYLLGGFGSYGTNYNERAVISQIGLGAFVPHQAIYAMAWGDSTGQSLNGSNAYTLTLKTPPPTVEGWSLTVYTLNGALVSNSLGRTAFTNISPLTHNSDGSITIYLQPTQPSGAAQLANWLPLPPKQGFEVTWRLFAPDPSNINSILSGSGWQPPAIVAK